MASVVLCRFGHLNNTLIYRHSVLAIFLDYLKVRVSGSYIVNCPNGHGVLRVEKV